MSVGPNNRFERNVLDFESRLQEATPLFADRIKQIRDRATQIKSELIAVMLQPMLYSRRLGSRPELTVLNGFLGTLKTLQAGSENYAALQAATDAFYEQIYNTKIITDYDKHQELLAQIRVLSHPPKVKSDELEVGVGAAKAPAERSFAPEPEKVASFKNKFRTYIEDFSRVTLGDRMRDRLGNAQQLLDQCTTLWQGIDSSFQSSESAREFARSLSQVLKKIIMTRTGPQPEEKAIHPARELLKLCQDMCLLPPSSGTAPYRNIRV